MKLFERKLVSAIKCFEHFLSMVFHFKTKIACFVRKFCAFAHVQTFSQLTITSDFLWKRLNIHISSVIFVKSMKLMGVFNSPYFLSILLYFHFNYFIFMLFMIFMLLCYRRYHRHLYILFLRSHKASKKCFNKNDKTHSDIILTSLVSSVSEISHLCLHLANILALPAFCIK